MEEHNGLDGSEESIFDLTSNNKKLSKSVAKLKKELEEASERESDVAQALEKVERALNKPWMLREKMKKMLDKKIKKFKGQ